MDLIACSATLTVAGVVLRFTGNASWTLIAAGVTCFVVWVIRVLPGGSGQKGSG